MRRTRKVDLGQHVLPDSFVQCRQVSVRPAPSPLSSRPKELRMYKAILVPLDGSATADNGLREAIELAACMDARLVLLHVVDDHSTLVEMSSVTSYTNILNRLRRRGQEILDRAAMVASESAVETQTCLREAAQARVAQVVVEEAVKQSCDLIVMGTHGRRGFSRWAMGSNAEAVVRCSPVPALLVRDEETATA